MDNFEASKLLVMLCADYRKYVGNDVRYAEAVAKAIAALSKEEDNDG